VGVVVGRVVRIQDAHVRSEWGYTMVRRQPSPQNRRTLHERYRHIALRAKVVATRYPHTKHTGRSISASEGLAILETGLLLAAVKGEGYWAEPKTYSWQNKIISGGRDPQAGEAISWYFTES